MDDRLPQYSMISNFSTGLNIPQHASQQLQQQQRPQTQQQQQDTHQLANFPDQARMWQVQQMQNQFRPHGGAEMGAVATNSQMADIIRAQNMARIPSQQQQLAQSQRPFPMANQMQGMNSGGVPSQPIFHDQNNLQQHPSQAQPHMSPGFTNMGMNPALQARPGMMQNFQNNSRQLDFLNLMAQNQHMQNGMNFARMNPQQASQNGISGQQNVNSSTQDIFQAGLPTGEALRRPSPSHPMPNMAGNMAKLTAMSGDSQENATRIATLRESIASHESFLRAQEASGITDLGRVTKEQRELQMKKQYLAQLLNQSNQASNAGWNPQLAAAQRPPFNNPAMARPPQNPQQPQNRQPNMINPAMGVQQPRPLSGPLQGQAPQMNGAMSNAMATSNMGQPFPFPMQPNMGTGAMNQVQQNALPPQGAQPQSQQPGQAPGIGASQASQPPLSQLTPQQQEALQQRPVIRPLDRERFINAYKAFCQTNPVQPDSTLMAIDGRQIDLPSLHAHVMQEGGFDRVNAKEENWNIIGGRMGFVHFPGTESEPPKSGPGVAQRLAQVYKECLYQFELAYTRGVNPKHPQLQLFLQFARFANVPAQRLRDQGANDKLVQWIDQNRPTLMRVWMQQQQRMQQDPNVMRQNGMPGQPPVLKPNMGMPSNFNLAPQQNPAGPPRPQFAPGAQQAMIMQQRALHQANPAMQSMFVPPTNEQLQNATRITMALKNELNSSLVHKNFAPVEVLPEQQVEYNGLLEKTYQLSQQLDGQLSVIGATMKNEGQLRTVVSMLVLVAHQRHLVSSSNPRYFLPLDRLRNMHAQLLGISAQMRNVVRPMPGVVSQPQLPQVHPQPMPSQGTPRHPVLQGHTPPQQPSPNVPPAQHAHHPSPQNQNIPGNERPMVALRPPIPRNTKPHVAPGSVVGQVAAVTTPTPPPAPSASTPNATTPGQSAASPQGAKSPKTRSQATPKLKANKPPQPKRGVRAQQAAGSTEPAQSPNVSGTAKRQREEESTGFVANSPATGPAPANGPSPPKKPKTEWEGGPPPGEASTPTEEVKTHEQASAFLEQMTELIKMASNNAPESLGNDISGALDQILTAYSGCADPNDNVNGLPSLGVGPESGPSGQDVSGAGSNGADEFTQFFDFSSLEEEDMKPVGNAPSASKAPTPELVGPSSAPTSSPESVSEAESSYHPHASSSTSNTNLSTQSSSKPEDITDYLRLGFWKEPDGGESAYYQSTEFKWDSPATQQDQPWAVFPSS